MHAEDTLVPVSFISILSLDGLTMVRGWKLEAGDKGTKRCTCRQINSIYILSEVVFFDIYSSPAQDTKLIL